MSQINKSLSPQNIVANIVDKKIYLEDMSDLMMDTVKEMGAFRMAFGTELVWLIECANEDNLIKTLQELNRLNFLFIGAPSGYPAADVFALLLAKRKLSVKFKEIRSRGPGDWFIIER